MFKIVIVEDDEEIREELKLLLQNSGYEAKVIADFHNIVPKILEEQAHLILLDVNLPEQNGYEICSKIRAKSNVPIMFVTSKNSAIDELNGMMRGADDYIEKPYNIPILLARINNLLMRSYPKEERNTIEYQGITLEILKSTIVYQDKQIELTKTELKVMYYLFTHLDRIVSREEIIDYLWDNGVYADDNSLSVNITRLREKLKQIGFEHFIETKRGQGYKI